MRTIILIVFVCFCNALFSQQVADTLYNPEIENIAYNSGLGPVVFIDEGHFNFHTKNGRYKSFSNILEKDGYKVLAYKGPFELNKLSEGKILVISNALNEINTEEWVVPNPSAFTKQEIQILESWVSNGGNLFLIADHMPMAGAATDLAAVFGFEFTNGFVFSTRAKGPAFFKRNDKTLGENSITIGRTPAENVNQIASFTGQAFKIPTDAASILTFNKDYINMLPDTAWVFNDKTIKYNVEGWSQGAYKKHGNGRIVVFGEAAMFSAQLAGPNKIKMGMNNSSAPENYQLLLNIIHWLDGLFD